RGQCHEAHPDDLLLHYQGDEVGDDGHRKGNGQPAVDLPNPVVPAHGILASRSTSFPPIISQPQRAPPKFRCWSGLKPDCTSNSRVPEAVGMSVKVTTV